MPVSSVLEAEPVVVQPTEKPRCKGTLLIVDDEDTVRQSLRIVFNEDYHVIMVADGPSAIQTAKDTKVDVAILDIKMPQMSGIEVLERLKYVDPAMEVIMLTAFETTDLMRQALRLRACDYITKPFDLATIRTAVATAMQRRTLASDIHSNAEKLQDLLGELQDQKVEEQMAKTRGEIYASIIHDINGPLTVISGFIQLMNQRVGHATRLEMEDLRFIQDRLKTITRQVANCIEISRRYLGFLRRQADDAPRVGVNQLLADLHHLIRVHPSAQNNQFTIHPLAEDALVRMNGTDVIQVLLNLAVNAFQCAPQAHSIRIDGRLLHEPIDLSELRDGPQDRLLNVENFENTSSTLLLTVSDNGPGIPPETLPKIFQPYFSTKGARRGTGLGLSIVQRLVKEAKGALRVHTQVGEGTSFMVYLPAVASATP